ncbi:MAG TPA: peptide chain release factor N(5)-glutamine methyltransferase [Acidobacteriaceae bacterium]|jgi:release factor glutamine methyltransferase|nr:peptide chain release factor N(5)-glutamine methyltransferase [Acidobacteriaceae bacterium]
MKTIRQAVAEAAQRLHGEYAARDAELLLMHAVGITRASVLANPQRELSHEEKARFDTMVAERATGKPIQHITGTQEFFGLAFVVNQDVLIPRPETEHLVAEVIARLPKDRAVKIADVGTGSGAIAVALAHAMPLAQVTALDISPAALDVAARNAAANGVAERVRFLQSELLDACAGEVFDAIVSNPPYIADSEILEKQVCEFEPPLALFAGSTGYEIYERLIPRAWNSLQAGGLLALEMGFGQSVRVAELLRAWRCVELVDDLQGIPRVALAQRV